MSADSGRRLVTWLKASFKKEVPRRNIEGIAEVLDMSPKTFTKLRAGQTVSNLVLEDLKSKIRFRNDSWRAIYLIDEIMGNLSLPVAQSKVPIRTARRAWGISPIEVVNILSDPKSSPDELVLAAASMDKLYFDGQLSVPFDLVERIWGSIQQRRMRLDRGLIPVGMIYAKLLSAQGRFQESKFIFNQCHEAAKVDENLRLRFFIFTDFLSVSHKLAVPFDPCGLDIPTINKYFSASHELRQAIESGTRRHVGLEWPAHYLQRLLGISLSRFVGKNDLTEDRKNLLQRCAKELNETGKYVMHEPSYANAHDIITVYLNSAIGSQQEACDKVDELIVQGQEFHDYQGLLFAKSTALRIMGKYELALEALYECEQISIPTGAHPHISKIRRARHAIESESLGN